ncbi:hypothetical protein HYFRA_00005900 [Hymenoscyphus fraxineus]|uniref:Zn(2)-C6 fungal-type domain-containing protein n=1 Tax=Hymenoscyphus fraxineus TaxID=746836 RepID=A0A9N9KVJ6_9HELO|nr:hypothetical protein HYFRA_00005900 [Hymenoscyphus fraxineus]
MDSPIVENAGLKRKRSPLSNDENSASGRPVPPGMSTGNVTQINYLVKARAEKLGLIEGDAETFRDVLGMIDEYEGVLQRHESLAANLGAKLVGPLLLKSFEKLFNEPIKIIQTSLALEQSISWLDIVTFARTNVSDFKPVEDIPGIRTYRVWIKGGQIEISEDDYRLIMSGAPERMIPTQPIAEDESAELGTLNILEARLGVLIKKADVVASKARQLNYHLKGRKAAVMTRKQAEPPNSMIPENNQDARPFSPQHGPVNMMSPKPAHIEPTTKMQQQLLEQFLAGDRRQSAPPQARPKPSRATAEPPVGQVNYNGNPLHDVRRLSQPAALSDDGAENQYRVLMAAKIDKLAKGDAIFPPCDRCRRLGFDCAKHLTACSACTKKHAKCSWKEIREGELEHLPQFQSGNIQQLQGYGSVENGGGVSVVEGHLDPGLRDTMHMGSAMPHASIENRMDHFEQGQFVDRRMGRDHATLTQIASAAAAAGNR